MIEKLKNSFRTFAFKGLVKYHQHGFRRFYRKIMKMNHIDDKEVAGEKEWIKKWSQLGAKVYPEQYRVFSHYIGPNIDIVPEDICHDYIEPILNPVRFAGVYEDKNMFDRMFPQGYFPSTVLRKMNGHFYDANYKLLLLDDVKLNEILNGCGFERLIIKPSVDGMSGVGVKMFRKEGDRFMDEDGTVLNFDYLNKKCGKDIIIQEAITQSEYIGQFNPTSVNTLRLSLYRSVKDDQCHVTGAFLRIGGKGSVVDNAHAGGSFVGIKSDGTFCNKVYDLWGQSVTMFNEVDFNNHYVYPNWEKVIKFAESVGQYVPHHRLLALDIVLDCLKNPLLIEFNVLGYAPWPFQYSTAIAWGKYTDEILEHCAKNQKYNKHILYI